MSHPVAQLNPQPLWNHFHRITQVPRPSKKEEKILAHLKSVLDGLGCEYEQDAVGNIVVRKSASAGHEKAPMVLLQGHVDMVCEKNKGTEHDFDNDPIQPSIDGEWVKAAGTTLGSDNGIGVAAALAILESKDLVHPPLEFLFTVDEETGLTGAKQLKPGFLTASTMLNMDSEEDGALYVGCAGGMDTEGSFTPQYENAPQGTTALTIAVSGLKGGHSGLEINVGRGNAIKLLARALMVLRNDVELHLASISGGSKRNAIPREAECVVHVNQNDVQKVMTRLTDLTLVFSNELGSADPTVKVFAEETTSDGRVIQQAQFEKMIQVLLALPHGVIKMSPDIPELVESSTNLATIDQRNGSIVIGTSQRSSIETEKMEVVDQVSAIFSLGGFDVKRGDGYPGWKPNMQSPALKKMQETYHSLFGNDPAVKAIHAGLECGLIGSVYPGMDMISFGPTIVGAHSPDERVHIPAVERFWKLLTATLESIAQKGL